jgi:hypothetical protein
MRGDSLMNIPIAGVTVAKIWTALLACGHIGFRPIPSMKLMCCGRTLYVLNYVPLESPQGSTTSEDAWDWKTVAISVCGCWNNKSR